MLDETPTRLDRLYPYARSADQDAGARAHHPVVVVGGGPVGLAAALDLGLQGVPALVLDDAEGVGEGSRAICFAKRTLEICDRLGCGAPVAEKGVDWRLGRVFHGAAPVYEFDLLPEGGHRRPAFVNLQQFHFERFLVDRIRAAQAAGAPIEIRGGNRVELLTAVNNRAALTVATPDGPYAVTADWVLACDGAGSPIRKGMGLGFEGRVFKDSFLIADVRMASDLPTERRFWFDPPFPDAGASALMHRQPDDVWRLDFQIGWDADRAAELREDRVRARIDGMLGEGAEYEIVWTSIYTFQCRRMASFRHGRVLFVGDAAHQVSPFGARGANGGMQDADNLAWKLARVVRGEAPEALIDSYDAERIAACDENIRHSTRTTDFIAPKSPVSRTFRDAVLRLARDHAFARPMVNSGRLSRPCTYDGSPLNGADALPGAPAAARPGAACADAPVEGGFLLDDLGGDFALLCLGVAPPEGVTAVRIVAPPLTAELRARYLGAAAAGLYLIRPDQHVAARWAAADAAAVSDAVARAVGMRG